MTSIYSPKALLTKQPVAIASAVRQALYVAVLMGLLILDEKMLAGIAFLVEIGLGLFVWSSVVPAAKVKEEQLTVIEEVQEEPLADPLAGDAP